MLAPRKGDRCPQPECLGRLTMQDGRWLVCSVLPHHRVANPDYAQQERSRRAQERF